jgi:hypothetical protein
MRCGTGIESGIQRSSGFPWPLGSSAETEQAGEDDLLYPGRPEVETLPSS